MSTYIMTDVHGDAAHFFDMINLIKFSPDHNDHLFVLGDVIDKGGQYGDNLKLLEYCLTSPDVTLLLGNHEYYMCKYLEGTFNPDRWASVYDGKLTLKEVHNLSLKDRKWYREKLSALPVYAALPHYTINGKPLFLSHAGIGRDSLVIREDGRTVNVRQSVKLGVRKDLRKAVTNIDIHRLAMKYTFDSFVICGHLSVDRLYKEERFEAYVSDNYMDLDCNAFLREDGGRLCCYCIDNDAFYYL